MLTYFVLKKTKKKENVCVKKWPATLANATTCGAHESPGPGNRINDLFEYICSVFKYIQIYLNPFSIYLNLFENGMCSQQTSDYIQP